MAFKPRARFDAERLRELARRATELNSSPDAELTCEYKDDLPGQITWRTTVTFEWHIKCVEFEDRQTVNVIADNAAKQGIHLPESWRTAIQCSKLDEIAGRCADAEKAKLGMTHLSCAILGQPK